MNGSSGINVVPSGTSLFSKNDIPEGFRGIAQTLIRGEGQGPKPLGVVIVIFWFFFLEWKCRILVLLQMWLDTFS